MNIYTAAIDRQYKTIMATSCPSTNANDTIFWHQVNYLKIAPYF